MTLAPPRTRFALPEDRTATEPSEARGLTRDGVRLLVATGDGMRHARFRELPGHLDPGDLVVVNTSATLAAALDGVRGRTGAPIVVHLADPRPDHGGREPDSRPATSSATHVVLELRHVDASGPVGDGEAGEVLALPAGARATLVRPVAGQDPAAPRLWHARLRLGARATVLDLLEGHGRPITYGYVRGRWPLAAYQTVFAREPGSAEMPSAARPFTDRLVTDLVTRGILLAPVLLHTGVSSQEAGEPPQPEAFRVPAVTARLVNHVRREGGRVVAVGTTVARALETVAGEDGRVRAGAGQTELVLGPSRPARVVDGLITGWHAPESSHLALLEAVAGPALVVAAYREALAAGYLWHELGDACLFLPRPSARAVGGPD